MAAAIQSLDIRDDLFRRIDQRRDEVAGLTASLIAVQGDIGNWLRRGSGAGGGPDRRPATAD